MHTRVLFTVIHLNYSTLIMLESYFTLNWGVQSLHVCDSSLAHMLEAYFILSRGVQSLRVCDSSLAHMLLA